MRAWVLVAIALLTASCRGDSDDGALPTTSTRHTTTTAERTTTTTTTTAAANSSRTTTASTAAGGTTTTTARTQQVVGPTVSDAPREAHTERTDNTGTLTYSTTPNNSSTGAPPSNDALEFTITCGVATDGHGSCRLQLTNRVTRDARFPDGLKVTITMQRTGAEPLTFDHALPHVTTLRPGETAFVDATFDLDQQGTYSYFATTTIAWP